MMGNLISHENLATFPNSFCVDKKNQVGLRKEHGHEASSDLRNVIMPPPTMTPQKCNEIIF
jgi:hypothetical protein